jgi:cell division protein FtsQ
MNKFDYNQPNTRERVAARRKASQPKRRQGSLVLPGPRRAAGALLASGRVISFVLFFAAMGGLLYIFTAPAFAVHDVRVEGAQVLKSEEVEQMADARGQSVWFVDTDAITDKLKQSAYVEQAGAYVTLPGTLTLQVQERRPELRWQVGGTRYLVDASGRVLGIDSTATLTDALVISDQSNRALQPNDRVDADALTLGRTLSLRLPGELGIQLATINWNITEGISVVTNDGRTIIFGKSDRLEDKLMVLNALLHDGTTFTFLDLRPTQPYYRDEHKKTDETPTPQQ